MMVMILVWSLYIINYTNSGDLVSRFLTLYNPPPFIYGCSHLKVLSDEVYDPDNHNPTQPYTSGHYFTKYMDVKGREHQRSCFKINTLYTNNIEFKK